MRRDRRVRKTPQRAHTWSYRARQDSLSERHRVLLWVVDRHGAENHRPKILLGRRSNLDPTRPCGPSFRVEIPLAVDKRTVGVVICNAQPVDGHSGRDTLASRSIPSAADVVSTGAAQGPPRRHAGLPANNPEVTAKSPAAINATMATALSAAFLMRGDACPLFTACRTWLRDRLRCTLDVEAESHRRLWAGGLLRPSLGLDSRANATDGRAARRSRSRDGLRCAEPSYGEHRPPPPDAQGKCGERSRATAHRPRMAHGRNNLAKPCVIGGSAATVAELASRLSGMSPGEEDSNLARYDCCRRLAALSPCSPRLSTSACNRARPPK